MVVLCISAIRSYPDSDVEIAECPLAPYEDLKKITGSSGGGAENNHVAKIELTDGWYSLDALLDAPLTKHLVAGKLFVGQKLRIWGAGLCGWVAPVSPLESSKTISLVIHINGTYRAHWADRLGFCKGIGAPLAFRCIKCAGGPIPRTLVGVTRIYPILYEERLANGGFVVRSEKMEARMVQLYNQSGYMSPEYAMHGKFSIKLDVFSFGVLLLEIVSGLKNYGFHQSDLAEDLPSYEEELKTKYGGLRPKLPPIQISPALTSTLLTKNFSACWLCL